ncbi:MAG: hypothetical protein EG822_12610 [Deltaproteobacteria bacterium]|nr:hypothetical protein [Deltaproteobacteria bacterium]TLN03809.1 MAG: hypothetical protein FDZ73_06395 [bacterium]
MKIKKVLLAVSFLMIFATASSAFAPLAYIAAVVGPELAPYVAGSAVIHGAAAIAGLYYYLRDGGRSSVTPDGKIKTPAEVQWIDLKEPAVKTKPLNTETSLDLIRALTEKKDPNDNYIYPALRNALNGIPEIPSLNYNTGIGQIVTVNGSIRRVTAAVTGGSCSIWEPWCAGISATQVTASYPDGTPQQVTITKTEGNTRYWKDFTLASTAPPPPGPLPLTQVVRNLSADGTGTGLVNQALQNEINRMHQDPDYVPTFSDETTGLPHAAPPLGDIATPKQVADYNKAGKAQDAQNAASAAQAAAVSAAQTAATGANNRAAAANAAAAANPGDAGLAAAAAAAQAAADAANAALAKALADQAGGAAEDAQKEEDETVAEIPSSDTPATIDMAPLHALKGALDNTYPFNLPGVISGYYQKFVANPETPVFDLPLPLGQTLHIDLSVMEPIAILFRYMIGIVTTVGALAYMVHFFRGIS